MKLEQTRTLEINCLFNYPTVTHHHKGMRVIKKNGKSIPIMYDKPELTAAIALIRREVSKHDPETPFAGYVRIDVCFNMPITSKHRDGDPHVIKPDRDNLLKTLKDCLAKEDIIANDAQDFGGNTEKYWSKTPGVRIKLTEYKKVKE